MSISDPYEGFSEVFDQVVSKLKYDQWEAWIKEIWSKHGLKPVSLLDVACGTGINSVRFSKHVPEVFGVDSSPNMLKKATEKNSSVHFTKGHFLNFEIPQKVDAAFCLDFSTNYILRSNEFVEFLSRVYDVLNEGGIFIFDCKPVLAFSKKAKDITTDAYSFKWVCNTTQSPFVVVDVSIVVDGTSYHEKHVERGYTVAELKQIISQTDFTLEEIYGDCEQVDSYEDVKLQQFVLRK
jgi:ubiquinone/menaquinone biosynthesis C-methylase UbiE